MSPLSNALLCFKATRGRFQRLCLIPKELRYCLRVLIILLDYGRLRQESFFKPLRDIRIKYFHANSIMKVTPLLLAQKITRAVFGEIVSHSRKENPKNDR